MLKKLLVTTVFIAGAASVALAADPPKPADTKAPAAPAANKDAKPATPPATTPPAADKKDAKAATPPATTPPAAAAAPAAAPPPPNEALAKNLKGMEGKWKCEAKYPDTAFGKAHGAKAEFTMKSDLNGYFYAARYEEKKAKDNPVPYVMAQTIGFDPSKSELVRTDVDGMGAITHLSSKGWDGDKMVWSGETMSGPQKLVFKETMTKKSDKEVSMTMELGPDGSPAPLGEIVCKK